MALPFMRVSFIRSNGNGVMEKMVPNTPQVTPKEAEFVQPSGYSKSFSHLLTITPVLPGPDLIIGGLV